MAEVDFDAALRWARRFRGKTLARRPVENLPGLLEQPEGIIYLLDTCVYIDSFHNTFAPEIERVIDDVPHCHSVCALQELALAVGLLDPNDRRTRQAAADVGTLVGSIVPQPSSIRMLILRSAQACSPAPSLASKAMARNTASAPLMTARSSCNPRNSERRF